MSKRIICAILTLVLVISLVPAAALTASAANMTTSDKGVDLIKAFEGFKASAYLDGTDSKGNPRYSIGYGTLGEKGQTITPENAEIELKKELTAIETALNAKNWGMSQTQFDALVSFSYNVGTGWLSATSGRFYQAVVGSKTGNEFLEAIALWSNGPSGTPMKGLVDRRLAEANLYLNGVYSTDRPANFCYTYLNVNGGKVTEDKVRAFDSNYPVAIGVTPTHTDANFTFSGWFTDAKAGTRVTTLDSSTAGKTLYAHWQQTGDGKVDGKIEGTPADYSISADMAASLNVYKEPSTTSAVIDTLKSGSTIKVVAEYAVSASDKWVKISTGGWVSLGDGSKVVYPSVNAYAKAAASVYDAAGGTKVVASLKKGDKFTIAERKTVGGAEWAKATVGKVTGWIKMADVSFTDPNYVAPQKPITTGTVTTETLRIRSEASVNSKHVGNLKKGTRVEILEIVTGANKTQWGRIKDGWISLIYVDLDSVPGGGAGTEGKTPIYTATVTSKANLRVRKDPSIKSAIVTTMPTYTKVNVYEIRTVDGKNWALTDRGGWSSADYLALTKVNAGGSGSESGSNALNRRGKVVNCLTGVNIRSGAGIGNALLGVAPVNSIINLYEQKEVNGVKWARSDKGWVCMTYIQVLDEAINPSEPGKQPEGGSATLTGTGVVTNAPMVNVRKGAGMHFAIVTSLANGTKVTVYETTNYANATWGRIDQGWIYMHYVKLDGAGTGSNGTGSNGTGYATGYVSSRTNLAIRSGAGMGYPKIGSLTPGTKVTVYEQQLTGGMIWGRIDRGWICLSYVTMDSTGTTGKGTMGTVARCYHALRVRSGPGVGNAQVGTVLVGSRVEILEQTNFNGQMWGRIAQGWVSMDYIVLDNNNMPIPPIPGGGESGKPVDPTQPAEDNGVAVVIDCTVDVADGLNIRSTASESGSVVRKLNNGDSVRISSVKIVGSKMWGKMKDGWIDLTFVSFNAKFTVNVDAMDFYKAADKASDKVNSSPIVRDTSVTVTDLKLTGSTVWGRMNDGTNTGWGEMSNLKLGQKYINSNPEIPFAITGTVQVAGSLNIRSDASSKCDILDSLADSDSVSITALKAEGTDLWGKVTKGSVTGWISLQYVKIEKDCTVKVESLNVYRSADTAAETVGAPLTNGASVKIIKLQMNGSTVWGQFVNGEGAYVWVQMDSLNH